MSSSANKFIHLLYAPTNFCNMGCQYCYLGTGTDEVSDVGQALETLSFAVDKLLAAGVTPFNLSFHGGEATALPKHTIAQLFEFSAAYYQTYGPQIKAAGFPLNPVHVKTNLYNFDQLFDIFVRNSVSVSGSIDLPLRLHEKYRTDKRGKSTLAKITKNLRLLADYPHHKKISCVVTREHLHCLDEFIADILYIHHDIGLDMTKFNIMFSFDSIKNDEKFDGKVTGTEMLSGEEQVFFYEKIKQVFMGTDLEPGLREHWFKEFTPEFCCSAVNCGDKFFLLQNNGDVYACPRGQASLKFRYGNVYKNSIAEILASGWKTIETLENSRPPADECYECAYLPYCNQGCVFVREETGLIKSYTCDLQKAIYADYPQKYPPYTAEQIKNYSAKYKFANNVQAITMVDKQEEKSASVTTELYAEENSLKAIIAKDKVLQALFKRDAFKVAANGRLAELSSPILKTYRDSAILEPGSSLLLHVEKSLLEVNCKEPVNNYLHVMLLRNTMVQYGDEQRVKQEHIADYSVYTLALERLVQDENADYWILDLAPFLNLHASQFISGVRNNLYFTTKTLREYHYQKQRNNGFYHIQALNLPFPYFEFYWV